MWCFAFLLIYVYKCYCHETCDVLRFCSFTYTNVTVMKHVMFCVSAHLRIQMLLSWNMWCFAFLFIYAYKCYCHETCDVLRFCSFTHTNVTVMKHVMFCVSVHLRIQMLLSWNMWCFAFLLIYVYKCYCHETCDVLRFCSFTYTNVTVMKHVMFCVSVHLRIQMLLSWNMWCFAFLFIYVYKCYCHETCDVLRFCSFTYTNVTVMKHVMFCVSVHLCIQMLLSWNMWCFAFLFIYVYKCYCHETCDVLRFCSFTYTNVTVITRLWWLYSNQTEFLPVLISLWLYSTHLLIVCPRVAKIRVTVTKLIYWFSRSKSFLEIRTIFCAFC